MQDALDQLINLQTEAAKPAKVPKKLGFFSSLFKSESDEYVKTRESAEFKEKLGKGVVAEWSPLKIVFTAAGLGIAASSAKYLINNSDNINLSDLTTSVATDASLLKDTIVDGVSSLFNSGAANSFTKNITDPLIGMMSNYIGDDMAQIAFYSAGAIAAMGLGSTGGFKGMLAATAITGAILSTWNNTEYSLDRSPEGPVNDIARYMDEHFGRDGIVNLRFNGGGSFGPDHVVPRM